MYNNSILYCWGRVYVWGKEGQRHVEAERKKLEGRGEGMGKGKEGGEEEKEGENSHRADLDRNKHGFIWAMETFDACFDNQLFHSACQCP